MRSSPPSVARRWRAARSGSLLAVALPFVSTGCVTGPAGSATADAPGGPSPERTEAAAAEGGAPGTLRQEEISLTLRTGPLLIRITPLGPDVTRVAAPDTRGRLDGLRERYGASLARRVGSGPLFLVSVFSTEPNAPFHPEDLHLLGGGLRHRPTGIEPITPGWGSGRVGQRETAMAVYAFPPALDPEREMEAEYGPAATRGEWSRVLSRIQAERSRIGSG